MANALQERHTAPALESVRREFDELIDRFLGGTPRSMQRLNALLNEPAIESYIEGDKMVVRAEMPGMDPNDIEVTVNGNMLTIRGSREEQHEEKGRDFLHREISHEQMERAIMLPPGTTDEGIKASYKNGILELMVPISKEASTKKVQVQSGNGGNGSKHR
jgi:HSP20 family protein